MPRVITRLARSLVIATLDSTEMELTVTVSANNLANLANQVAMPKL